ncbi:MAG TPA: peptide deformylase [bacterium]|jgi:peptide deformylase|nr:peptide deformylase [bacterium]
MALLPIRLYPDPVLRLKTRLVDPKRPSLEALVEDLFETMYDAEGVGLAANQVGLDIRVAVIDTSSGRDPAARLVLLNPRIISESGDVEEEEGCLSFPGLRALAKRAESARVQAVGMDGVPFEVESDGLLGKALQHEVGHLDGRLFIDYLPMGQKALLAGKLKQMKKEAAKGAA